MSNLSVLKTLLNIYLLSLFLTFNFSLAQNFKLNISVKNNEITSTINYKKEHLDTVSVKNEIFLFSKKLSKKGYFENHVVQSQRKDSVFNVYFSLGKKVSEAKLCNLKTKAYKTIQIEFLEDYLQQISNKLNREGKAFSDVQLKNIHIKKNILYADIGINESEIRTIDKVIVKGYENFSKSHIKHFLNIKKNSVFSQEKLNSISKGLQALSFVSEIKPAEALFSRDNTVIYMYPKKKNANTFDGLLNFSSQKNGELIFNGHLNLNLTNILHAGEVLGVKWRANGNERQDFRVSSYVPYLFNSVFSPELNFSIYRQDSAFLNTKFDSKLHYNITQNTKIAVTYELENSNQTDREVENISGFSSQFLGFQLDYKTTFNSGKFSITLNPAIGKRNNQNQFRINFEGSYLTFINDRNSIFIRNKTGILDSNDYLDNEIYRIGGVSTIRGFNEQSVFTSKYSFFNLEYRYSVSGNSYLYSISDFGKIENNTLIGLGVGYLFFIKNSSVNLNYSLGATSEIEFNTNQSKIGLQIINKF